MESGYLTSTKLRGQIALKPDLTKIQQSQVRSAQTLLKKVMLKYPKASHPRDYYHLGIMCKGHPTTCSLMYLLTALGSWNDSYRINDLIGQVTHTTQQLFEYRLYHNKNKKWEWSEVDYLYTFDGKTYNLIPWLNQTYTSIQLKAFEAQVFDLITKLQKFFIVVAKFPNPSTYIRNVQRGRRRTREHIRTLKAKSAYR